ncbi:MULTISPECIES: hypothetical protein [unclassified Variovorax]|uniref:hypothetical protein n=1 Tax=unclassified Variovorax TaxID=663243 RepID=UPI00076C001B|nr:MULTISPECIES: hypothetical protein [unclassified Variovorax]KWT74717.1 hypothetical protein APY03_5643 [Variovorax sp. WDL1]PNG53101.1 hypothetical protein CHC06_04445 [Variovorax sp. B2]PNG53673.1 hypothetical protein CHC07_03492 [Variovorax sp. B4]VTV11112.1 hypothetical protein WDL1CHR_02006 [Variovorax sp. WDL1]
MDEPAAVTVRLRELLRARSEALNHKAVESGGNVDAEELASLDRLSKALRIAEEGSAAPGRWWHAAALLLALGAVSVLFLVRVPNTRVTIEIEASAVEFALAREHPVIGRAAVTQLGVSGVDAVRISPDVLPQLTAQKAGTSALRLAVPLAPGQGGAINTAALVPPAGTLISLRHMGFARTYRLSLKNRRAGTPIAFEADVRGLLSVAAPGVLDAPLRHDFGKSGASIRFESRGDTTDVDLVLAEAGALPFYAQIPVDALALTRLEEFALPHKSVVAPLSTVLGGSIFFESLDGARHPLRAGEHLRLEVAEGRIESLRLLDDRIALKFRGSVSAVATGEEDIGRDLMPSLLQWLKARQPLSLVWGATIFLYGLIVSATRWYRRTP